MATSTRAFLVELYEEYLEEASFLYEQRLSLLDDPQITWKDIGDFEDRFEAHIDGLVVGGDLALETCRKHAIEGDFGELHAALRVFCRQRWLDMVLGVSLTFDQEDAEKVQAFSDAFKHELPSEWQDKFLGLLPDRDDKLTFIFDTLWGYRRLKTSSQLLKRLEAAPAGSLRKLIWALGRIREESARPSLVKY